MRATNTTTIHAISLFRTNIAPQTPSLHVASASSLAWWPTVADPRPHLRHRERFPGRNCDDGSRAEQSRAEQSRAEQSRAEQSRAEQSRAEQSRAEQSRAPEQIICSCPTSAAKYPAASSSASDASSSAESRMYRSPMVLRSCDGNKHARHRIRNTNTETSPSQTTTEWG